MQHNNSNYVPAQQMRRSPPYDPPTQQRIEIAQIKKAQGRELTSREELLLAFTVNAPACHHPH